MFLLACHAVHTKNVIENFGKWIANHSQETILFVSPAKHRDHFVRRLSVCPSVCPSVRPSVRPSVCLSVCLSVLSVRPSVTPPELCFAGDTCIPRNAATIFLSVTLLYTDLSCDTVDIDLVQDVWQVLSDSRTSTENDQRLRCFSKVS